eukprot:15456034-Alexandrium_andersonii.AAC.1
MIVVQDAESRASNQYLMVGGATLVEAIYCAAEMEPTNAFIVQLRESGLTAMEFRPETPKDILEWVKLEHNSWHHGVSFTCLEMHLGLCLTHER